jgi:hypothetical protein
VDEVRTRTGRIPRLLSRALIVLGGAIAGTAVAWLISTATASADPAPPDALPLGQPGVVVNVVAPVLHTLPTAATSRIPVMAPALHLPATRRPTVLDVRTPTPAAPAVPATRSAPASVPTIARPALSGHSPTTSIARPTTAIGHLDRPATAPAGRPQPSLPGQVRCPGAPLPPTIPASGNTGQVVRQLNTGRQPGITPD